MAIHYRTQAFILKKADLREADQVFSIYTKDFGKLKILGKAIRKIKSKLRSGAELFYLSEIEFIQGKAHKTLTDAILIEKFKNIRGDLGKLEIANQIAGVTDDLINGEEKDERVFDLLNETFNKLDKLEIIYHYFLWNLLSVLGYQIDLYNCVGCQKKLRPQNLYLSFEEGGIVCLECSGQIENKEDISPDVIKILRIFLNKDWHTLSRLKIGDSYKKALESVSENYLSYYKKAE